MSESLGYSRDNLCRRGTGRLEMGGSAARPGVLFSPPARRGAGALRAGGNVLEAEGRADGPGERLGGGLVGAAPSEREDVWSRREQEAGRRRGGDRRDGARERGPVWKSKFYGEFVLNHRVVLHAIDATPARWRGDADSSPLDGASTAASLVDFHTGDDHGPGAVARQHQRLRAVSHVHDQKRDGGGAAAAVREN